jgi:hypothetical protein
LEVVLCWVPGSIAGAVGRAKERGFHAIAFLVVELTIATMAVEKAGFTIRI